MNRNRIVRLAVILILPYRMEQFLRADHASPVFQKDTQDGKFGGRQHKRLPVQGALMCFPIQHKPQMA